MRYMVTNRVRDRKSKRFTDDNEPAGALHYLVSDKAEPGPDDFDEVEAGKFAALVTSALKAQRRTLVKAHGYEPDLPGTPCVRPVLCLYVHGYNNDFKDAVEEYLELDDNLRAAAPPAAAPPDTYSGVQVGFSWPSAGRVTGYPHDRREAVDSILGLYTLLRSFKNITTQQECIAETAIVAHSMGNYVLEETLAYLADELGAPPGGGLIDQTLMLAADVDNDILQPGGLGEAIANFSYRVTSYYSRHDDTLRKSQRLKHKGKRRLGRNGPESYPGLMDNVVAIDCRNFANDAAAQELDTSVHSSYKRSPRILADMRSTMLGVDREVVPGRQMVEGTDRRGYLLV